MEIETDKVTVEIEAPADGTLAGLSAAEGDDVPVGRVVAFVLAQGEELAEPVSSGPADAEPAPPAAAADERNRRRRITVPSRRAASLRRRRHAGSRGSGASPSRQCAEPGRVARSRQQTSSPLADAAAPAPPATRSSAWKTMANRMQASWRRGTPLLPRAGARCDAAQLVARNDPATARIRECHAHRSPHRHLRDGARRASARELDLARRGGSAARDDRRRHRRGDRRRTDRSGRSTVPTGSTSRRSSGLARISSSGREAERSGQPTSPAGRSRSRISACSASTPFTPS